LLTLSLHVVDHHGLHVVQDLGIHSDGGAGLDAADTNCLCLLLDPGDLCNCGFADPVESLNTRSNSVGDPLVLLPSCSVNLARLKAPGTRLSRNKVILQGSRLGFRS
jgi:hypothetical protein